jgi:hypothetical protein
MSEFQRYFVFSHGRRTNVFRSGGRRFGKNDPQGRSPDAGGFAHDIVKILRIHPVITGRPGAPCSVFRSGRTDKALKLPGPVFQIRIQEIYPSIAVPRLGIISQGISVDWNNITVIIVRIIRRCQGNILEIIDTCYLFRFLPRFI